MDPSLYCCLCLISVEREEGWGGGELGREGGRKEGRTGQPDSGPQSVQLGNHAAQHRSVSVSHLNVQYYNCDLFF